MLIVAISTLFNRLAGMKAEQFPSHENIKYVISCQGDSVHDDAYYESLLKTLFGDDVIWGRTLESGLSNNRNNAINLALDSYSGNGDYLYICDDDITLSIEGLFKAIAVMGEKNLSCLTGIIATGDGLFKNYATQAYSHSRLSAARVCSVEIIVDLEFVSSKAILFDGRFGLGSIYPSGEEFIFLNDIISAGGKAEFNPIILCKHPPLSSGDDFYSSPDKIMAKGAMFRRVFGVLTAFFLCTLFTFKKHYMFRKHVKAGYFYFFILKGFFMGRPKW